MNIATIMGRLGQDPEIKQSKSGNSFVKFSIATNDGFGDNKKTNWHNCTAFGKLADVIAQYCKKGDMVAVSGSIDYNKHEEKIYTTIMVREFSFTGAGAKQSEPKPDLLDAVSDKKDDDLPF